MDGALCEYSYARCHKCRQDALLKYKELHCQNMGDALCEYSYARCHKCRQDALLKYKELKYKSCTVKIWTMAMHCVNIDMHVVINAHMTHC
jgi:hypothetical protein